MGNSCPETLQERTHCAGSVKNRRYKSTPQYSGRSETGRTLGMRYAFYPGCASEHMAVAYTQSAKAVAEHLGIELVEIPDWNCCGATEYLALNRLAHYSLTARNLAMVPPGIDQIVALC